MEEFLMLMMLTWMVWPSQDRLTSTKASSVFKSSNALTMLEWKPALDQLIFKLSQRFQNWLETSLQMLHTAPFIWFPKLSS